MELRAVGYDEAAALVQAMADELTVRYGGVGEPSRADAADFLPPQGVFLLGRLDGVDVACGGVRPLDAVRGEVKRMYVDPSVRGRGLSRVLLRTLVAHARAAGFEELWLETGTVQPEAIGLYESEGFRPIPPYGQYADEPSSRCYALTL
jgi:GNAT superfamily N-acetyltransferase